MLNKIGCVTLYRFTIGVYIHQINSIYANGEALASKVEGNPVGSFEKDTPFQKTCIDYPRNGGVKLLLVHSLKWCPLYINIK
jgi:hypothetical protein